MSGVVEKYGMRRSCQKRGRHGDEAVMEERATSRTVPVTIVSSNITSDNEQDEVCCTSGRKQRQPQQTTKVMRW